MAEVVQFPSKPLCKVRTTEELREIGNKIIAAVPDTKTPSEFIRGDEWVPRDPVCVAIMNGY